MGLHDVFEKLKKKKEFKNYFSKKPHVKYIQEFTGKIAGTAFSVRQAFALNLHRALSENTVLSNTPEAYQRCAMGERSTRGSRLFSLISHLCKAMRTYSYKPSSNNLIKEEDFWGESIDVETDSPACAAGTLNTVGGESLNLQDPCMLVYHDGQEKASEIIRTKLRRFFAEKLSVFEQLKIFMIEAKDLFAEEYEKIIRFVGSELYKRVKEFIEPLVQSLSSLDKEKTNEGFKPELSWKVAENYKKFLTNFRWSELVSKKQIQEYLGAVESMPEDERAWLRQALDGLDTNDTLEEVRVGELREKLSLQETSVPAP